MGLYKYDKSFFERKANETAFIRDNLEKVYRLTDILEYLNQNPLHKECLALKGGTAINLLVFNVKRISVDIDLDFCKPLAREEMLEHRKKINKDLIAFLKTQGYSLNPEKGKNPHSLDSWVFWYINSVGNKDNIKVEINYSMRAHMLEPFEMPIQTDIFDNSFPVKALAPIELFGSKINALIGRAAPRDLYDIGNMIRFGTFDESQMPMLKKCFVFYYAVGSGKEISIPFDLSKLDALTWRDIRQALLPMLRRNERFDLDDVKRRVKGFLDGLLVLDTKEVEFLQCLKDGKYLPELLFDDAEILDRIQNHPMALWKTGDKS